MTCTIGGLVTMARLRYEIRDMRRIKTTPKQTEKVPVKRFSCKLLCNMCPPPQVDSGHNKNSSRKRPWIRTYRSVNLDRERYFMPLTAFATKNSWVPNACFSAPQ